MTYGIKLTAGSRTFKSIPPARQMPGYLLVQLVLDAFDGHLTEMGFATACNTLYNKGALFCISSLAIFQEKFNIDSFVGVLKEDVDFSEHSGLASSHMTLQMLSSTLCFSSDDDKIAFTMVFALLPLANALPSLKRSSESFFVFGPLE